MKDIEFRINEETNLGYYDFNIIEKPGFLPETNKGNAMLVKPNKFIEKYNEELK